jgi:superfamily II DNA or RNA helicase
MDAAELRRSIGASGGGSIDWAIHEPVRLPSGDRAPALVAPLDAVIGWLAGLGAGQLGQSVGPSARWMARVVVWAIELVANGRMTPRLVRLTGRPSPEAPGQAGQAGQEATAELAIRWQPALVDRPRLRTLASVMPGAVAALEPGAQPTRLCRAVLSAAVDAICRRGAARLVTPATVPVARDQLELSEAVLAGLAGTPFRAAAVPSARMAEALGQWASPVTDRRAMRLAVRLHDRDHDGGWRLSVAATEIEGKTVPVATALRTTTRRKSQRIEAQLHRLERLAPALGRSRRKGEVVLDDAEAWDLMTRTATTLMSAGFAVSTPAATRRRPVARLRLWAEPAAAAAGVGAQELARIDWSVLVDDDVELDATALWRLSAQALPLVRARGRWVELDHDDLAAAAKALAEQAGRTELSGAAILRYATGLEPSPLGGTVSIAGGGWAVDLVRGVADHPPEPAPAPDGFVGALRHYQAEARGWLQLLDRAGLGGCLALDMGLGKTPTVLAHLLATRGSGAALVIAPPAVLGNWAAETARFTPELRVEVHHGTARAAPSELASLAAGSDVVLTTYATAVRDIDALATVDWRRVVVDEAQTIKNPASDTAQQLRRLPARLRLALTGTPVENSLGDLWAILDFLNPGLLGPRSAFITQLSTGDGGPARSAQPSEVALRALNGLLIFRRTKTEPGIAAELPDRIDELDHCGMTPEQIGLYQAILDQLLTTGQATTDRRMRNANVLAAITALKQVCNHPAAYLDDDRAPLDGRSGKLARLDEIVDAVFDAGERILVFTHFARWGERLAAHLTARTGVPVACYHGGLSRRIRDRLIQEFQRGAGPGALVLSIKAGGTGLNLTAANHVVLYDRWWNPAVEDQARDRAWRLGQQHTVVSHRLICPGTIDERVEEIVAGKRRIADLTLPLRSTLGDLSSEQLKRALGLRVDALAEQPAGDDPRQTQVAAA